MKRSSSNGRQYSCYTLAFFPLASPSAAGATASLPSPTLKQDSHMSLTLDLSRLI
jgi:hypothetical protein